MGHNASWWALALAIAAIVLMIPGNLIANLLTPLLKNWWSERSQASTAKRIEALEHELAELEEKYPPTSPVEDMLLRGIWIVGAVAALGLAVWGPVILTLNAVPGIPGSNSVFRESVIVFASFSTMLISMFAMFMLNRLQKFALRHSRAHRQILGESIEKLRAKLH